MDEATKQQRDRSQNERGAAATILRAGQPEKSEAEEFILPRDPKRSVRRLGRIPTEAWFGFSARTRGFGSYVANRVRSVECSEV